MLKTWKQNAEAAIGRFSEKKVVWIFLFLKKEKSKKNGPGSSKNIKLHFTKNNPFHKHFSRNNSLDLKKTSFPARTTLGGRFQILRYKKKIDLRDYYNKTSLFLKTFKINH